MATTRPLLSPGNILIALANLSYAFGAFMADYSSTHIYNPRWPPHAKFHNGQTMTLSIFLSCTALSFLYKSAMTSGLAAKESLWWAAVIGSFYCGAGLCAILYPGTAWVDPDLYVEGQRTQKSIFPAVLVVLWVGYFLEVGKCGKQGKRA